MVVLRLLPGVSTTTDNITAIKLLTVTVYGGQTVLPGLTQNYLNKLCIRNGTKGK